MKIFTAAQIKEWDNYTIKANELTAVNLMEMAAGSVFEWLQLNMPATKHFIIFCGTGNNGGDGLVVARLLHSANYKVSVFISDSKKKSAEFTTNLNRLVAIKEMELSYINASTDLPDIEKNAVIIDALFGTGLDRALKNEAAKLVNHINKQAAAIISIDMPSGLSADNFFVDAAIIKATHTLSFQINKLAFFLPGSAAFTGVVHLIPIALNNTYYNKTNAKFETIDAHLINNIYKPRDAFAHKYNFGHALIYAGSKNMMGAAVLCTKACIRSGAGLATIQVSPSCEAVIHTSVAEAITTIENDTTKNWQKKSAIAFGPGMETSVKNKLLLKKLLLYWNGPLVIDASGLTLLTSFTNLLEKRQLNPAIITPHTGEFERLFGKTDTPFDTIRLATEKAASLNCYIILKGHHTLIACPDGKHFFNTTGNAGMATAGSGDTLTGIIVGLLAQHYTEKEACILGVYLHGLAGDIAAENISEEAMMASDITNCLGEGFKKIKAFATLHVTEF